MEGEIELGEIAHAIAEEMQVNIDPVLGGEDVPSEAISALNDASWVPYNIPAVANPTNEVADDEGSLGEPILPIDLTADVQLPRVIDLFQKFFDVAICSEFVKATNAYGSLSHKRLWRPVDITEMNYFYGCILYMGVMKVPQRHLIWSKTSKFALPFVQKVMSARRFEGILQHWHYEDASTITAAERKAKNEVDGFWIIDNFLKKLGASFRDNFTCSRKVDIDEMSINFKPREFMHCFKTNIKGNDYYFTGWVDNRPVHFLSTFPPDKSIVRRNSKNKNGNYVPLLLHGWYYNEGMGGTDRFDQYGSYYNTSLRTRKWHIRIFTHFLQAAVINAYILYVSKYKASLPYIEFLDLLIGQLVDDPKEIVDSDSESSEIEVKPAHNPKKRWRTTWQNDHSRLCGEHFPVQHSQNGRDTRTLCMFCKKRKPSQKCSTCGVSLCTLEESPCFTDKKPCQNQQICSLHSSDKRSNVVYRDCRLMCVVNFTLLVHGCEVTANF